MKKKMIVLVVVLLLASTLTGCGWTSKKEILDEQRETNNRLNSIQETLAGEDSEEIADLKQQLSEALSKNAEYEQQTNCASNDATYVQLKFPSDGNYYKEAYDEIQFYSDSECGRDDKIFDVRFMSPEVDTVQAEKGFTVYCLRMDSGEICYCTESPYLITESKYIEMHEEAEE